MCFRSIEFYNVSSPQSTMMSKILLSAATTMNLLNSSFIYTGHLKDRLEWSVLSFAKLRMGLLVASSFPFIFIRKIVGASTEHWRTSTLIRHWYEIVYYSRNENYMHTDRVQERFHKMDSCSKDLHATSQSDFIVVPQICETFSVNLQLIVPAEPVMVIVE